MEEYPISARLLIALRDHLEVLNRERDDARTAAREILQSVVEVVSPKAADKVLERAGDQWPWLTEGF